MSRLCKVVKNVEKKKEKSHLRQYETLSICNTEMRLHFLKSFRTFMNKTCVGFEKDIQDKQLSASKFC